MAQYVKASYHKPEDPSLSSTQGWPKESFPIPHSKQFPVTLCPIRLKAKSPQKYCLKKKKKKGNRDYTAVSHQTEPNKGLQQLCLFILETQHTHQYYILTLHHLKQDQTSTQLKPPKYAWKIWPTVKFNLLHPKCHRQWTLSWFRQACSDLEQDGLRSG